MLNIIDTNIFSQVTMKLNSALEKSITVIQNKNPKIIWVYEFKCSYTATVINASFKSSTVFIFNSPCCPRMSTVSLLSLIFVCNWVLFSLNIHLSDLWIDNAVVAAGSSDKSSLLRVWVVSVAMRFLYSYSVSLSCRFRLMLCPGCDDGSWTARLLSYSGECCFHKVAATSLA